MTDHEETAKRLLPCEHTEDLPGYYNDPANCYQCAKRPAVAAALAEAEANAHVECPIDQIRAKLDDAERERDNWKARFETMEGFWRDLKAELDEARKEPERLYYEYEQHLQTLNAENESLKAERAAAFVKGLRRAADICSTKSHAIECLLGIRAEIDKAGRET